MCVCYPPQQAQASLCLDSAAAPVASRGTCQLLLWPGLAWRLCLGHCLCLYRLLSSVGPASCSVSVALLEQTPLGLPPMPVTPNRQTPRFNHSVWPKNLLRPAPSLESSALHLPLRCRCLSPRHSVSTSRPPVKPKTYATWIAIVSGCPISASKSACCEIALFST